MCAIFQGEGAEECEKNSEEKAKRGDIWSNNEHASSAVAFTSSSMRSCGCPCRNCLNYVPYVFKCFDALALPKTEHNANPLPLSLVQSTPK